VKISQEMRLFGQERTEYILEAIRVWSWI